VGRVDRWIGLGLILLGSVVVASGRAFPDVPGQKLGAAFLPVLVGAGLALCGALLAARSLRSGRGGGAATPAGGGGGAPGGGAPTAPERLGPPAVVLATVAAYIGLSPVLGFLLVAPPCLAVLLRALGSDWRASIAWALLGTVVVHVAFYKLLRVPLPWGVLRPFY
jgi:putative tricarboxylic transport membrane protein